MINLARPKKILNFFQNVFEKKVEKKVFENFSNFFEIFEIFEKVLKNQKKVFRIFFQKFQKVQNFFLVAPILSSK